VKKIGIVVKTDPGVAAKADALERWLAARGVQIIRKDGTPPHRHRAPAETADSRAPSDLFCIFVLGGDGTFLSAVRWIGDQNIPILGVKFGEVGFLAEIAEDRLFPVAESILNGPFTTRARMRLKVSVVRDDADRETETVLNDVVINKGAFCPFTLTNRPLIIPDGSRITLRLVKGSTDIMLTFDGQRGLPIDDRDTIVVRQSHHPIHMIIEPGQSYYDVLKAKLRWSGGRS
jgi:NAD+ kinase